MPFCSHKNQKKNQNFEKKKKKNSGNIIILHMCSKNHNHMMCGSWGAEWDRQNFLAFWTIFCPFTPLTIHKMKIMKKWKKNNNWGYYWFTLKPHKWQSYHIWFLKHGGQQRYFLSFWTTFCIFTSLTTWKIKTLKNWKKYLEILSFYTCVL